MSKHANQMNSMARYIACGMVVGSAVGTAAAVMLKSKNSSKKNPPMQCLRDKAANAMDTVGCIMQNLADMTR